MKKSIYTFAIIIFFLSGSAFLTSCGSGDQNNSESTEDHMDGHDHSNMAEAIFACPMHPEITGKKEDKCSKCGMFLTKAVDSSDEMKEHEMDTVAYNCPMHPNEAGIKGDKCSKCKMDLVAASNEVSMKSCKHKDGKTCGMCATKEGSKCDHKEGDTCPKCKKA